MFTCLFHFKSLLIVRLKTFAWVTTWSSFPLRVICGEKFVDFLRYIKSSLHLCLFKWRLILIDQFKTSLVISCKYPQEFLGIIWETVVSSIFFHLLMLAGLRSLIRRMNSHGPNFVPWGTLAGMTLHSK